MGGANTAKRKHYTGQTLQKGNTTRGKHCKRALEVSTKHRRCETQLHTSVNSVKANMLPAVREKHRRGISKDLRSKSLCANDPLHFANRAVVCRSSLLQKPLTQRQRSQALMIWKRWMWTRNWIRHLLMNQSVTLRVWGRR